jgi:hypothetical protein
MANQGMGDYMPEEDADYDQGGWDPASGDNFKVNTQQTAHMPHHACTSVCARCIVEPSNMGLNTHFWTWCILGDTGPVMPMSQQLQGHASLACLGETARYMHACMLSCVKHVKLAWHALHCCAGRRPCAPSLAARAQRHRVEALPVHKPCGRQRPHPHAV